MKVEVSTIEEQGFIKEESIEASLWDLDSRDVEFVKDIHLCCEFKRIHNEILVEATVSTERQIACSRCLELITQRITQELVLSYERKKLGKFLEVDGDIREDVLLNWPMKPLCKDDCKGICFGCGKNLNLEVCICKK